MIPTDAPVEPRTVHIVDAHLRYPDWSEGGLTRTIVEQATEHLSRRGHTVTITRTEEPYDPALEVERLIAADLVVLQTPINWFGPPWTYKRYVDEVFNDGLHSARLLDGDGRTRKDPTRQYGTGGRMQGRGFLVSATWAAPAATFSNPLSVLLGGSSVDDLLLATSTVFRFVGFDVLESHHVFDAFRAPDVAERIESLGPHLERTLTQLPVRQPA